MPKNVSWMVVTLLMDSKNVTEEGISLIVGNRRSLPVLFCPKTIRARTAVNSGTENRGGGNKRVFCEKFIWTHCFGRSLYTSAYW